MYYAQFTTYESECEGKCERLSIHYEVIGDGYPVVMLHGWTLDHPVLMHAMEPLFEKRSGMAEDLYRLAMYGALKTSTVDSELG